MLRAIGGVILGYVTMFVIVFATFIGAYTAIGADRVLRPGTYEISVLWGVISIVLGLAAAVIGGIVCARVAGPKSKGATLALCVLVLVAGLGLVVLVPSELRGGEAVRGPEVSGLEALDSASSPRWHAWLNPPVGAVGVLVGGRVVRSRRERGST